MKYYARRAFLKFLAASPALSGLLAFDPARADPDTLASASDALDVFDLESAAQRVVPPAMTRRSR
jgi:hypothetical protein